MRKILLILCCFGLSSCAYLYHVQIGEVNSKTILGARKFEVLVSETGVSTAEIAEIGKALTQSAETKKQVGDAQKFIDSFQMGPRTGLPVYNDKYADVIATMILKECPHGQISGLMSIREQRKYPVISGEIVKIVGYCKEGV